MKLTLLTLALMSACGGSWAVQPIQAATIIIMKDSEVTVKIVRNKKNTDKIITVVMNPQDHLIVSTLPPRGSTNLDVPPP